ncbi:unnamed protein product [Phytophthora fragariaefolia]|uniref:Unnamed protein product n=1 Tax=Phytophthora fragariaefolia TaxID=1490495 RepID=A0A9W6XK71_9STRA|nr:unnamed protein product [Phytophthora fragariaefolia]
MPSLPSPEKIAKRFEREQANARAVCAYKEGRDWHEVARSYDVNYSTARHAVLAADEEAKAHGGLRASNVKLTVDAMAKLEEYIEEDCRRTLTDLRDKLESDLGISVCKSSIHRALQGMLYSTKRMWWSRIGERAVVTLPPSQGQSLHVQGGVSSGTGLVLLRTHERSIKKEENARFLADLFMAALRTDEFQELEAHQRVVIVTDNAPAHSGVENLAHQMLAEDGVVNLNRLEILRHGSYSPMLNPIPTSSQRSEHIAQDFQVKGGTETRR